MTDTVLFEIDGPVARLTLNNPARHNSLGETELRAIQLSVDEVNANSEVRVLLVTGSGEKTFCAGASLNQLDEGKISSDFFQATTDKLAATRVPTICALNGNVFGGGVELALSCDFRVGVVGSRMRVPAAEIGLCYPVSGINRYVERLGVNVAKRILVAAETFSSEDMLTIGFLERVVPAAELQATCAEMADNICGLAPLAVQAMKQILQQAASGDIDLEAATKLSQICAVSDDLQEGFAAQKERRAPVFTGR
jgi:enoyl-CoA hydratase